MNLSIALFRSNSNLTPIYVKTSSHYLRERVHQKVMCVQIEKLSKTFLWPKPAMDNLQITEIVNRCDHRKKRFRGFCAKFCGLFCTEKRFLHKKKHLTSPSYQHGAHWLLFAQAGGQIFFADPLGKRLYIYPLVYKKKSDVQFTREIDYWWKNQYNRPIQCYADSLSVMSLLYLFCS